MATPLIPAYTLLEPLGYGGMAVVYRARQDALDRIVAVKVLSENLAGSEEFLERFRREAMTAANMHHPNVITVHDFGQDERGVPYLVLEFIEGATLADLIDAGLDDARIPDLLDQVAAGLDYAHRRGVVHRDVKPGNVLLTEDGRAVLADFGLAWLLEGAHLTMAGGVIGTPEYMSPEQSAGDSVDHRTDVYALGVVLFEMLTGERPFVSDQPLNILLKHLQSPIPSILPARPDLSDEIDAVVHRALAKDPDERFQSAGDLARAYRAAFFGVGSALVAPAPPAARVIDSVPPSVSPDAAAESNATLDPRADVSSSASAELNPSTLDLVDSDFVDESVEAVAERSEGRPCPNCAEAIPDGAGICPACTYMIPLEQLIQKPRPSGRKLHRRQVVLNLLPYRFRWDPTGLSAAREMAGAALRDATVDGWEPASIGEPCRLVAGRTINGAIVRSAILCLERVA